MHQCLYRHFNSAGELLYVGISLRALNRLGQHRDHSGWFHSISKVEIVHYETRQESCEAERIAIADENPKHNIIRATPKSRMVKKVKAADVDDDNSLRSLPELSRGDIVRRYVDFHIAYTPEEVARYFDVSVKEIERLFQSQMLGHVRLPAVRNKKGYCIRVTGWQLIDYVEHLQAQYDQEKEVAKILVTKDLKITELA